MGMFDSLVSDISNRVNEVKNDVQSNVQKFLSTQITEPLIKVGALPSGNLTEAEIAAGRRGTPKPIAPPRAAPATIARSSGTGALEKLGSLQVSIPVAIAIGAVAVLILKKRG